MQKIFIIFKILWKNPRAFAGFLGLLFFLLMAFAGPLIIPLDMTPKYLERFLPPGSKHILGTDYAGRDIFMQIVHGSKDIIVIAFSTAIISTFIAVVLGIMAGFMGGWVDTLIMRIVDIFLTVPHFPIMAIFAALFKIKHPFFLGVVLAIWSWPSLARAIRSQILSLKEREFIQISIILGMGLPHIMFKELLPNIIPYISINFINIAKNAITASVGIMLLGLVPLSVTNWGMMLNLATFQTGAIYVPSALSYLLSPLFAIVLLQYSLLCFAGGVEEIFDPRLRKI